MEFSVGRKILADRLPGIKFVEVTSDAEHCSFFLGASYPELKKLAERLGSANEDSPISDFEIFVQLCSEILQVFAGMEMAWNQVNPEWQHHTRGDWQILEDDEEDYSQETARRREDPHATCRMLICLLPAENFEHGQVSFLDFLLRKQAA